MLKMSFHTFMWSSIIIFWGHKSSMYKKFGKHWSNLFMLIGQHMPDIPQWHAEVKETLIHEVPLQPHRQGTILQFQGT
jgi:hypothetical protein